MYKQLTNPEYLQYLLEKNGIVPEHSAGQNFLVCEEPLEALVASMEGAGECVTELGAGVGTATAALVSRNFRVRAIERDPHLAALLKKNIPKKQLENVTIQVEDLREVPWEWSQAWQLVGNIPYNLSGYIIRRLTELPTPPSQALFMVQREVGERLAAEPPAMNLLGLAAQLWGTVHILLNVPRSCFMPAPEVDSVLVLLVPHGSDGPVPAEREAVLKLAKIFFQQKRKQMGGVGKRALGWTPEQTEKILNAAGIAATARPQEVSVEQWRTLTQQMTKAEGFKS